MSMNPTTLRERIINSALWAAYGDALGFAAELVDRAGLVQRTGLETVDDTRPWNYKAGGRYGIVVKLPAGTYSDDTQLRFSTCRALSTNAKFDVDSFAKIELPVFLSYALGAGKGTKASAVNLIKDNIPWFANFYNSADGNYLEGGGNGAAMRIQPHVWAASHAPSPNEITLNVIRNSICTHGHPRALIGALIHAHHLLRIMTSGEITGPDAWFDDLRALESLSNLMSEDDYLGRMWIPEWERRAEAPFSQTVADVLVECREHLALLRELSNTNASPVRTYSAFLERIGGYDPKSRGSGTKTAVLASALAWLHREEGPDIALRVSANTLGSDTDTIGTMAGALMGAFFPQAPMGELLDRAGLIFEAERMHDIAVGHNVPPFPYPSLLDWSPPKTGLDAYGRYKSGFAVAGLGPARPMTAEEFPGKDTVWRWVVTDAKQTLLIKSRPSVGPIEPGQISAFFSSDEAPRGDMSPPAPTRSSRSPIAEPIREEPRKAPRSETRPEPAQRALFAPEVDKKNRIRGRTIDEWVIIIEKSGFAPDIIGRAMLEVAEGPDGIERSAAFGAAFAQLRRFSVKRF